MKPVDTDVLIVGAGLVGTALALALKDTRLSVLLVDGRAQDFSWPADSWDSRIYAISPPSRRLLEKLGAWQRIDPARLQTVQRMQIYGDAGQPLQLDAPEAGLSELATIVESRVLQQALWQAATEASNISLLAPVDLDQVTMTADTATLRFTDGSEQRARLLVGADGAQSWVRKQAGIQPKAYDYRQFGVVANFAVEKAHHSTAFQWFREDGVLAWLPLPGNRISMVWSCSESLKDELLALDTEQLAERVAKAGGARLGKLSTLTMPAAFPLKLNHVAHLVAPRLALVGDAAHTVHPLAGQGVNLGFGDVAELAGILSVGLPEDCGDLAALRRYERSRREPVFLMQGVCHGLQKLFNNSHPLLKATRNLGLGLLDQSEWLKRQLIRQASRH